MDEPTSGPAHRIDPALACALARAQAEFGPLPKAKSATIQTRGGATYGYSYSDLAATLEAVRQPLARHELAIIQLPRVRYTDGPGCVVGCETLLVHSSGASVSAILELPVGDPSPQSVGSALTYSRRYSLSALLAVSGEDEDDDAAGAQPKAPEPRPARERKTEPKAPSGPALASENQRRMIWGKAKAKAREHVAEGDTEGEASLAKEILRAAGVESSKEITSRQVDAVLAAIESYAPPVTLPSE